MPSKSKSQQRLFGMALAVRKGELKRSEVEKEVLDICREIIKHAKQVITLVNKHGDRETAFKIIYYGVLQYALLSAGYSLGIPVFMAEAGD